MKSISLIIGMGLLLSGIILGRSFAGPAIGAVVATTDTINTFRLNFNSLDEYVRSTTSTLGTFSNLATTTGNIVVATTSAGWRALAVGSNGQFLRASSSASLGVAWETFTGTSDIGTSTAVTTTHFPYWNTARLLNGTSSLQYTIGNNLLLFANGASSSQLWSASTTFTGVFTTTNITATNATTTNLSYTNATGTNIQATDFTGNNVFGVASTTIQNGSFSINLIQPSSTTDGNFYKHQFRIPITLTRIDCFDMLGTSTINFERRASSTPNTASSSMIGNLDCGISRGATTTFSIATATVEHVLNFQVITATGIGTTSTLTIVGQYTK